MKNPNKFSDVHISLAQKIKQDAPMYWNGSRIQIYVETPGYTEFEFVKYCFIEFKILLKYILKDKPLNIQEQLKFNYLYEFLNDEMLLNKEIDEFLIQNIAL
jgi:hypothetical protein